MTAARPMRFRWTGEAMAPFALPWAQQRFQAGRAYLLDVREERSRRSHNHFWAALQTGFDNLPEQHAMRFPTRDHLKAHLLIQTGYRNERTVVLSSKADAQKAAAFMRSANEFAVVVAHEATVVEMTPKSISEKAMGKAEFQRCKTAVLALLADMIGVEVEALTKNAGRAA